MYKPAGFMKLKSQLVTLVELVINKINCYKKDNILRVVFDKLTVNRSRYGYCFNFKGKKISFKLATEVYFHRVSSFLVILASAKLKLTPCGFCTSQSALVIMKFQANCLPYAL